MSDSILCKVGENNLHLIKEMVQLMSKILIVQLYQSFKNKIINSTFSQ